MNTDPLPSHSSNNLISHREAPPFSSLTINHREMLQQNDQPCLTRWYIDTRALTSTTSSLPLLETLQPCDQEKVKKFYHLPDRHMSLASNLLKYLFIHRTCRVPWKEISISRTPAPHHRPCFVPTTTTLTPIPAVEFNVSHQASMVALAGTTYTSVSPAITSPTPSSSSPNIPATEANPRVGIDITCADEPSRRGRADAIATRKDLHDFVDIFAEVFSARELETMKTLPFRNIHHHPSSEEQQKTAIKAGLRLFYTYWALKEAYIKMTGEALLAPWLRELEFTDVVAPEPVDRPHPSSPWGIPYRGIQTWLYGRKVEDVRIEVVAFEKDYLVATAARGRGIGGSATMTVEEDSWRLLEKIDIERDVAPCALGKCDCLDG